MLDPWVWCTCTSARVWAQSLASTAQWLDALVSAAPTRDAEREREARTIKSTSATRATARGSALDTTTTRIPASWSASSSW